MDKQLTLKEACLRTGLKEAEAKLIVEVLKKYKAKGIIGYPKVILEQAKEIERLNKNGQKI